MAERQGGSQPINAPMTEENHQQEGAHWRHQALGQDDGRCRHLPPALPPRAAALKAKKGTVVSAKPFFDSA